MNSPAVADASGDSPRPRARGYTRFLVFMMAGAWILDGALFGLGMIEARAFRHLGIATAIAVAGALVWEPIARQSARAGGPGLLAWLCFPLAMLCTVATLPFLAMAVYPGLEGMLFRVEGSLDETSRMLELRFPLPIQPGAVNLRLGAVEITAETAANLPGALRWVSPRVLQVGLAMLPEEPPARWPGEIEINAIPRSPPMRYESGDAVPEQKIALR